MSWSGHALTALRDAGLRRGGARRAVVDFLEEQDCCRSAQEIHDGIVAAGGTVGVASVYRTLDTLADLHLVQRVDVGDGIARFEPSGAKTSTITTSSATAAGASSRLPTRRSSTRSRRQPDGSDTTHTAHEVVLAVPAASAWGNPWCPPRAPSFTAVTRSDATYLPAGRQSRARRRERFDATLALRVKLGLALKSGPSRPGVAMTPGVREPSVTAAPRSARHDDLRGGGHGDLDPLRLRVGRRHAASLGPASAGAGAPS